jgi:putative methyltransferase
MHNVYLFQPQYTTIINGKTNNWLPYSIAAIWSYAVYFDDIASSYTLKDIIFKRENISKLLDTFDNPKVCAFSCYLWNRNYCLAVAEQIKQRWPDCAIVFGGPEVSSRMIKHKFIDALVMGEGEENFVDILRNINNGVNPSLFSPKQRLPELDIPSPYLTGLFDKIITNNPDVMWAITLETNRGCPYSCTFCDWGSLTYSKVKKFNLEKVYAELEWTRGKPISYIYLADANFGMFKERDLAIAKKLKEVTDNSNVDLISVQAAKQSTEVAFQIGQALGNKYGGVSIAMQSMSDTTLEAIKRKNLPTNNIKNLLDLSVQYQIPTYTEMILGMPNETKETWCDGMADLLELGQHNSIEMWFTQLLENSELAQANSRFQYNIKSVISKNYISMKKPVDWDDVDEETELISSTNTMSLDDMVESYMFGWMIIQLHIAGYSQIISKYMRYAQGITFKSFYSQLMQDIQSDDLFTTHYHHVRDLVNSFLKTGIVQDEATGHMLHSVSGPWLYENKQQVINFVKNSAEKLGNLPSWVVDLQQDFIYDNNQLYPLSIKGDYNIIAGRADQTAYTIISKLSSEVKNLSLATVRRRGLLKNTIIGN